jgi:hypothetical protein
VSTKTTIGEKRWCDELGNVTDKLTGEAIIVGHAEGTIVKDGGRVGALVVGEGLGRDVGLGEGWGVGATVGVAVGAELGLREGGCVSKVGDGEGGDVFRIVGKGDGRLVSTGVIGVFGKGVGCLEGPGVTCLVGEGDG